ncbi:hypothetical protein MSAN_01692300 [Mycena sanguinolenta]|uniref:Uncharacterized protein n=1 Tax=Mycena sanguinolenta TaxID=230812 RepID=A0A8H6XXZ7_9AGAR|nr:hypothetical protein MSAN_01692300 [Mycena sanguinolenta]
MARTTRSGTQWSPWEFDGGLGAPLHAVDVFRCKVALVPYLTHALAAADRHAAVGDSDDGIKAQAEHEEWEDEAPVLSRTPSPFSRPLTPLSPLTPLPSDFSRSPSPMSDVTPSADIPMAPVLVPAYKRRQAAGKKSRRSRNRVAKAQASVFGRAPQLRHIQRHKDRAHSPHSTTTDAANLSSSSHGSWIGPAENKEELARRRLRSLQHLLDDGCELIQWDGRCTKLILDADGRIVAILLGRPGRG